MNVFMHELKAHRKALIIWSVSVVIFMAMSMAKFGTLSADAEGMRQIMSQFPQTMQAVFGMSGLDITTLGGYFGICFLYIELLLAIHGGLLGVSVLAEEEQDKTTEFLYVKPVGRAKIITQKLMAGLLNIFVLWGVTAASAWVSIEAAASMKGFEKEFMLFMGAALLIQLVFFFVGSLAAGVVKNSRSPGRYLAIAVFVSYVLFVFSKLSDSFDWLKYVSVFRFFDAAELLANKSLNTVYVAICAGIIVVCAVLTYVFYIRRDLEV